MHVIEGVLSKDEIAWLRALVRRSRFADGTASAAGAARSVKSNQQLEPSPDDARQFNQLVMGALRRSARFSRVALPLEICAPLINRYAEGMNYGAHYDAPFMPTASGPKLRADLSATLFLSDPADYDGGELSFSMADRRETVKLNAGDLVLYPASTLHAVAPVTRGERLAVVFWLQSLIRDYEKRCLVAEVDGVVARLAEQMPGSDELRDLSGVVTNLLRMWAET
jgi:PKHD-type hydroxylase